MSGCLHFVRLFGMRSYGSDLIVLGGTGHRRDANRQRINRDMGTKRKVARLTSASGKSQRRVFESMYAIELDIIDGFEFRSQRIIETPKDRKKRTAETKSGTSKPRRDHGAPHRSPSVESGNGVLDTDTSVRVMEHGGGDPGDRENENGRNLDAEMDADVDGEGAAARAIASMGNCGKIGSTGNEGVHSSAAFPSLAKPHVERTRVPNTGPKGVAKPPGEQLRRHQQVKSRPDIEMREAPRQKGDPADGLITGVSTPQEARHPSDAEAEGLLHSVRQAFARDPRKIDHFEDVMLSFQAGMYECQRARMRAAPLLCSCETM